MKPELRTILEKQQYRLYGDHAAVKLCHWVRESLLRNRYCYKQEFYGIKSHRCLQMTPVVNMCTQNCIFCWRVQGFESLPEQWSEPEDMLDALLNQQKLLVSGFKGDERCEIKRWEEARNPKHVAISLAGEPTMYPYLSDFIEICHKRGLTTFLVTNGTMPNVLENLYPLPTQLYVTVAAPNEEIYKRVCIPKLPDGWKRLKRTLELLPSLDTRKVIRHTLVQDWNIGWEDEYAKLDELADPTFIEPKGYVFVGQSRQRLNLSNMPLHSSIKDFARRLGMILGLEILKEKKDSRVVLLGEKHKKTILQGLE
ncbi:MAG: 4-demethylwyosine synthase TYW1 [Methanomassiliicoccales archaeon]